MIVAAHQPVYLPGIILFNKMALADVFVFLSDVQLARGRSWQTRNRIRNGDEAMFLSVPIARSGRSSQAICETEIAEDGWSRRHVASLRHAYGRRPFFKDHFEPLAAILCAGHRRLADLNIAVIRHLATCLGLAPRFVDSRDLGAPPGKNERLIEICRGLGASGYVSNSGSATYVDEAAFARAGVQHLWQHFEHPVYEQGAAFLPQLSAIDLLFNTGPIAAEIVRASGTARVERPAGAPPSEGLDAEAETP